MFGLTYAKDGRTLTQRQSQQNVDRGRRMTIGQVARRAGLSTRAVRFYEREAILPPAPRTTSGYRTYTEHDLELLSLIARLRAVGLGLADIREVVRLREHGVPPPERVIRLLEVRLAQLDG